MRAEISVIVIGGHGFIGRHLGAALADAGADVRRPGRPELDLRDAASAQRALERLGPAVLVNLARVAGHEPGGAEAERGAVANLLDAALEAGCERLVQLGSGLEYGSSAEEIGDDTPLRPDTEFGRGRAEATELVLSADRRNGMRTAVLRPFMVYGPGEPERRLIPAAAAAALAGRPLPMTAPALRRDWVYVADVVQAILAALDGGADGEAVNLATGRETSNEEIVELVGRAAGRPVPAAPGALEPRPWDVSRQRVSPEKARRLLGWRGETSLPDGVARTVAQLLRRDAEMALPAG